RPKGSAMLRTREGRRLLGIGVVYLVEAARALLATKAPVELHQIRIGELTIYDSEVVTVKLRSATHQKVLTRRGVPVSIAVPDDEADREQRAQEDEQPVRRDSRVA